MWQGTTKAQIKLKITFVVRKFLFAKVFPLTYRQSFEAVYPVCHVIDLHLDKDQSPTDQFQKRQRLVHNVGF